jgi:hypothetical protein
MKQGQGKKDVAPHAVLDAVKAHFNIDSDRDLAKVLGMLPSGVCKLRKKIHGARNGVPAEWVIAIHKATKWPITRIERLCEEAVHG